MPPVALSEGGGGKVRFPTLPFCCEMSSNLLLNNQSQHRFWYSLSGYYCLINSLSGYLCNFIARFAED